MLIEELVKSISQRTTEELLELKKEIRQGRRTAQEKKAARKTTAKKSSVDKLLGDLSPEDAKALLAALQAEEGGD
jgi:hypothetical protein